MIRGETRSRAVEICMTPVGLYRVLLLLGWEHISFHGNLFKQTLMQAGAAHFFFSLTSFCFGWTLQVSVGNNNQASAFSFLLTPPPIFYTFTCQAQPSIHFDHAYLLVLREQNGTLPLWQLIQMILLLWQLNWDKQ